MLRCVIPTKWRSYRDHRLCDWVTSCYELLTERTSARPVLYVDGLRLVLSVVVLNADEVRVGGEAETAAERHDVVVAAVQHLHHLPSTTLSTRRAH